MAEYGKIRERIDQGNPPELQTKLDAAHERLQAMLRDKQRSNGAGGPWCKARLANNDWEGHVELIHARGLSDAWRDLWNDLGLTHVELIHAIWLSDAWRDLWNDLGLTVLRLSAVGLDPESSDAVVWRSCQEEGLVLVTGNRNADVPVSLERIIRGENRPDALPVITLANPHASCGIGPMPRRSPSGCSSG